MSMKQGLIRVGVIVGLILAGFVAALYIMFGPGLELYFILPVLLAVGIGLYLIGFTTLLVGLAATKQRKWSWGIAMLVLISILLLAMIGWYVWYVVYGWLY